MKHKMYALLSPVSNFVQLGVETSKSIALKIQTEGFPFSWLYITSNIHEMHA